jgi:very-short-patch-repair endonuclease
MRDVLARMPADGPALESHVEVRILDVLRAHGVPLPDRQVKVRVNGRSYRLDLAYVAEKVVLEGDGFGVHSLREVFESDRVRQNELVLAGWLPLRYTDRMLRRRPAAIAAEVRAVLRSAA